MRMLNVIIEDKYILSAGWYIFFTILMIFIPLLLWYFKKKLIFSNISVVGILAVALFLELSSFYFLIFSKEEVQIDLNWSLSNYDLDSVVVDNVMWTKDNLNVDRFRNGEIIPEAKTPEEWKKASEERKPVWCYYGNDSLNTRNGKGKLYNAYAVLNESGLAPEGWHIASKTDYEKLIESNKLDQVLNKNLNARWWNGKFSPNDISFSFWWSASDDWNSSAWALNRENGENILKSVAKGNGFYVRCVKDF